MKKQISAGLFSSVCKAVAKIYLKILHRHQVRRHFTSEEKRREEKLTLKSSSNNSIRSHQDSFHTNYKFGSTWHDLDDDMSEEDILQVAVTISLETVRNNFITEEIHFTKSLKYLLSNIILCD